MNTPATPGDLSRRQFLKSGAALSALPVLGSLTPGFAAASTGSDRLKIGLVGCGGRGISAVRNCIAADKSVTLHALGDLFPDRLDSALREFREGGAEGGMPKPALPADQLAVTPDRCFTGFDAYQSVLKSGIDLVLLITPPHFRPLHIQAAVAQGVHVFAEKPVAVDPVGARLVIEAAEAARQKKLSLVAGTQRRHAPNYVETMSRIRDGAIGDIVAGECYWVQGGLWHAGRQPQWSEMEYQLRNWLYFTWLSGDHIVEQHVHNIDVMNWAFGGPPVKAIGMGGRQSRTDPKYGNVYDHFGIEFEYANGARVQSYCRQVAGASIRVGERLVGTKGSAVPGGGMITAGGKKWEREFIGVSGYDQEHVDLVRSIREGKPINEGRQIAETTLTAILGRVVAYTGRELSFAWLAQQSKLDLRPAAYAFGEAPAVEIAVPGQTKLV